ncbi:hypothetical protein [Mesobacillus foraminis]|nr:hypothetical protein [Mesobacillus foraminis]
MEGIIRRGPGPITEQKKDGKQANNNNKDVAGDKQTGIIGMLLYERR